MLISKLCKNWRKQPSTCLASRIINKQTIDLALPLKGIFKKIITIFEEKQEITLAQITRGKITITKYFLKRKKKKI